MVSNLVLDVAGRRVYNTGMTTTLKRSKDRKVANLATKGGAVAIANAFGLPAGIAGSCPDMTSECEKVCYARRTEKQYKAVDANVRHNFEVLSNLDFDGMVAELSGMIADFEAECEKRSAEKAFRIHWDGDFFSIEYAKAWAEVIRSFPATQFWVYTRSFVTVDVLPYITGIDNLAVYLSVDSVNTPAAAAALIKYGRLINIATLTQYANEGKDVLATLGRDKVGAACPENIKRIPLITEKGGACFTCQLCVVGKADIRFATKKKVSA